MRRTGHIYERSPGSCEIRYSLGTNPLTGKRRTVTVTVRGTRKDAEMELRRLLRTIDDASHVDPSRINVRQWLQTWLDEIADEISPKTHERYAQIVDNFLAQELGNVVLTRLTPGDIGGAYIKWQTQGRLDGKPGGLAPRTRRHIHRILRSALARAVEQHRITTNPADAFRNRLPKVERKEMRTLTTEQSGRMLEAIIARADGEPYAPNTLTQKFALAVRRMKDIPSLRFHDLRHSHATQLLLAGVHPKVCQERLGHATISTTLDLYSHVTETMQEDAAERLDAVLGDAISRAAQK